MGMPRDWKKWWVLQMEQKKVAVKAWVHQKVQQRGWKIGLALQMETRMAVEKE